MDPAAPRLTAEDVCLAFAGRPLLRHAALTLAAGEIAVLEGPSGCGKSTFLRVLARLVEPDRGRLTLDAVDARVIAPETWRRRLAYVPQLPVMFEGTVAVNLAAGPSLAGRAPTAALSAALVARVGLPAALLERDARALSGGERMRVAIARALANEPAVLLLDEPTAALDAASAGPVVALVRVLAADGTAVVVVTHAREHADALGGTRYRFVDGAPRRGEA